MRALTVSDSSTAAKKIRQELHGRGSCLLYALINPMGVGAIARGRCTGPGPFEIIL